MWRSSHRRRVRRPCCGSSLSQRCPYIMYGLFMYGVWSCKLVFKTHWRNGRLAFPTIPRLGLLIFIRIRLILIHPSKFPVVPPSNPMLHVSSALVSPTLHTDVSTLPPSSGAGNPPPPLQADPTQPPTELTPPSLPNLTLHIHPH